MLVFPMLTPFPSSSLNPGPGLGFSPQCIFGHSITTAGWALVLGDPTLGGSPAGGRGTLPQLSPSQPRERPHLSHHLPG